MTGQLNSKRVLVATSMNGGAEAVSPVAKRLRENGAKVRVVSYAAATASFRAMGIEPDRVLEKASPKECRGEIRDFGPDSVLTGTQLQDAEHHRTLEQMLWTGSVNFGVRTVAVLDTWDNLEQRFRDLNPDEKGKMVIAEGTQLILPSTIAAPGISAKQALVKAGVDKDLVVVTGNPYFQHVMEEAEKLPASTRETLLAKPVFRAFENGKGNFVVVFMSDSMSSYPDMGFSEKSILQLFLRVLDDAAGGMNRKVSVIVRPHPFRGEEAADAFDIDTPNITKVLHNPITARGGDPGNEYTMEELLRSADMVAGTFNNPLITAAVLGKIVVQCVVGISPRYDFQQFLADEGAAIRVHDEQELAKIIDYALRGRIVPKQLGAPGEAVNNVIGLL